MEGGAPGPGGRETENAWAPGGEGARHNLFPYFFIRQTLYEQRAWPGEAAKRCKARSSQPDIRMNVEACGCWRRTAEDDRPPRGGLAVDLRGNCHVFWAAEDSHTV